MNDIETEEKIYSKVGGWLCLDFHNTVQSYKLHNPNYDYFKSYRDLTRWARQAELITTEEEQALNHKAAELPQKAVQLLEQARALRDDINSLFSTLAAGEQPDSALFQRMNGRLAEAMSHSCIEQTEDG